MLRVSVIFFVLAIISAVFGFTTILGVAAIIFKVLYFIFLAIFVTAILFSGYLFKK